MLQLQRPLALLACRTKFFSSLVGLMVVLVYAPTRAAGPDRKEQSSDWPRHVLTGPSVKLTIFLPDAAKAYYRGTRFDWSGIIGQAECQGHTFFGPWKATHDPLNPEDADGTAEEFGIASPLGYNEAQPGETFVKIGVGVLEKPKEPQYAFMTRYKLVAPAVWKIRHGDDWIEFAQELNGPRSWSYQYLKRIDLAHGEPGFAIRHELKNTGTKTIDTEHYCHNFVRIDELPVGPDYRLEFPFAPESRQSLREIAMLKGHQLSFVKRIPTGQSLFAELAGSKTVPEHNRVTIAHSRAGVGLLIQGDAPLTHFNVFAVERAVCAEPFVKVHLEPGQEMIWTARYTLQGTHP